MGTLIFLRSETAVGQAEDAATDQFVDPRETPIGAMIVGLSTPNRPGEPTPFRPNDAPLLLEHLLKSRHATFWDEEACRRARQKILSLMTDPLAEKREYAERKLAVIGERPRTAEAWVGRSFDRFTAALRAAYQGRGEFLNENRLAFLRAAFIACLYEPNERPVLSVAPPPRAFVPHADAPKPKPPIPFVRPSR